MNQTSTHQEIGDLLPSAALETLEPDELARVLAHARECTECSQLLSEYREAVAAVALSLPHEPLNDARSARLRERLLLRARGNPAAGALEKKSIARARFRWGSVDRWAGWAVAAGLAGVLLTHHGFHRPLDYGWVLAGVLAIVLVIFGVYAVSQRRRVSELEDRLEHQGLSSERHPGPAQHK
jgi:hypothetical protein